MRGFIKSLLFIGFCNSVFAAELTDSFTSRTYFSAGTAVWNQALGTLHSSLRVMNFRAGFAPKAVAIGDGSHGSFELNTYANFSQNGDLTGSKIRVDTNVYPILKVTSFKLEQGWTIEPVGPNPLIIYSLSDVVVEGTINCSGGDATSASGVTPGIGGIGRCGGKNGGDGGATSSNGSDGEDVSVGVVTGGTAGNFTGGAAVGGGGGGSWNTTSLPGVGPNVNGGGGQAGFSNQDPEMINLLGGAGGGGGSGTAAFAGGGGGAGGGVIVIHAARDFILGSSSNTNIGSILANGGDGGDSDNIGGPGGGGGGGSIQVFVGRNIELFNVDVGGASQAASGTGGGNTVPVTGAAGGPGRSWYSSVNYNLSGTGFYTPPEELPVNPGNVEFDNATQTIESQTIELGGRIAAIDTISISPSSNDFQLEVSASSDNFINDDSGWTTDLSLLTNKKYIKFRVSISTSNVNDPAMVDSVTISYTPFVEDFDFTSGGCGIVKNQKPLKFPFFFLLLPLMMIILLRNKYQKA